MAGRHSDAIRAAVLFLTVSLSTAAVAVPGDGNWDITIASWNLLNLGPRKAGLPPHGPQNAALISRFAQIMSRYDIVFVQELLDTGTSLTTAIAQDPQMANYNCQTVSMASGRVGRQERYGVCYATARLALTHIYDWMAQPQAQGFNSPQPPQNVWMRPPLRAFFTYTPQDGTPYSFEVNVSHTKPAFGASGPPAGTPPNAPNNQSVYYELWGFERNTPGLGNTLVLGDLNSDCASYPVRDRNRNFQAGWTWYINYGEKTNTAAGSDCAYDRLIFNTALNQKYRNHGIYRTGINVQLNGKRVSDHYLVWAEIGNRQLKRAALAVAAGTPVQAKRARIFPPAATGGAPLLINSTNVPQAIVTGPKLFIVAYDQTRYFGGNQTYPLVDVRGAPTPVTITSTGSFASDVTWPQPRAGSYTLVLDVNGDGKYIKAKGDIVNEANEIDFLVTDISTLHSDVVTVGDNAQLRELFSDELAVNIYAIARGLTAGADVDLYVVSDKLLPAGFPGWAAARAAGTLNLPAVSVPVNVTHGPLMKPSVTKPNQVQTVTTGTDGTLFTSVWKEPATLFNTAVLQTTPPVPDYKPEYAKDDICDDTLGDFHDCDPCSNAWLSPDLNFRQVCNVWPAFTETYGTAFNVVIDANRNGIFDNGDLVDTHDIGDITAWLQNHAALDASADGNPAVGEYKEYLDSKLNLASPLPPGNIYDEATKQASQRYMCSRGVPSSRLAVLREGAQVGFQVLAQNSYAHVRQYGSGLVVFEDAFLKDVSVAGSSVLCMNATDLTVNGFTSPQPARTTVQASNITVTGDVRASNGSTVCLAAGQGIALTATGAAITLAGPNPFSAGATLVLGAFTLAELAVCALGY